MNVVTSTRRIIIFGPRFIAKFILKLDCLKYLPSRWLVWFPLDVNHNLGKNYSKTTFYFGFKVLQMCTLEYLSVNLTYKSTAGASLIQIWRDGLGVGGKMVIRLGGEEAREIIGDT